MGMQNVKGGYLLIKKRKMHIRENGIKKMLTEEKNRIKNIEKHIENKLKKQLKNGEKKIKKKLMRK